MNPTRRTALFVAVAVVVLTVVVPVASAGAQSGWVLHTESCDADDNGVFTVNLSWSSSETGNATLEVSYQNPDGGSNGRLFRNPVDAGSSTQAIRRTLIGEGATVTWTWTHASGTQTGTILCEIPPPPDATLNDLEATLTEIHAELEIVDARLTNINRNVQLTTTNVQDVENLLTATNATLALMANELGPRLESLRVTSAAQLAQGDGQSLALDTISYRLRETDAVANQLRNQTHALLALVALMFALWLRPIFRSRKQAT